MLTSLTSKYFSSPAETPDRDALAQIDPQIFYPRLVGQVNLYGDRLVLVQRGREFVFQTDQLSGEILSQLLLRMDGSHSIKDLETLFSFKTSDAVVNLVNNLDKQGLLDNAAPVVIYSGKDTLLALESLAQKLLAPILFGDDKADDSALWSLLQVATPELSNFELPNKIIYGFALEHYYLFSQVSCFQVPTLSFQDSINVRPLLNTCYQHTSSYEQLIAQALSEIHITSETLGDVLPLPQTASLANALTFWANFEPLFFLSMIRILFNSVLTSFEHYLIAIEQYELDDDFIRPIRQLIETQRKQKTVMLTEHIFQEISHVAPDMQHRFKGQLYLFIEIYCNFHRAIGQHYGNTPHLLRQLYVH